MRCTALGIKTRGPVVLNQPRIVSEELPLGRGRCWESTCFKFEGQVVSPSDRRLRVSRVPVPVLILQTARGTPQSGTRPSGEHGEHGRKTRRLGPRVGSPGRQQLKTGSSVPCKRQALGSGVTSKNLVARTLMLPHNGLV